MPQVWVTYTELANLFSCNEDDARKLAGKQRLDQRRGRDGELRFQLCPIGMAIFADKLRAPNEMLDRAIESQLSRFVEIQASLAKGRTYHPWIS